MAVSFLDQYLNSPKSIRNFIYSDEYYNYLDEYLKKFEIPQVRITEFIYLLQDLIFKVLTPRSIMELKDIIKTRIELNEDLSNQLAYALFNHFLPKIDKLWQIEKESKEVSLTPEIGELIKKIKEVKEKTRPTKVINLQKIVPSKKENKKEPTVDIAKLVSQDNKNYSEPKLIKIQIPQIKTEELSPTDDKLPPPSDQVNITIPSIKTDELTKTFWSQNKEKNEKKEDKKKEDESKVKVIIKRQKSSKTEDSVIDLSSY